MTPETNRKNKYTPRGPQSSRALKLTGLLGFATVRQLCLTVWDNERTTNDNLNRLLAHHFLQEAHEAVTPAEGRGNRLVFLTRTGMTWVVGKGQVREEDIAYYWRGEGDWHPTYSTHAVAVHDVLCAFIKQASDHPDRAYDLRLDPQSPLEDPGATPPTASPLAEHALQPDRIFAVKCRDRVVECYVEVDLGTEGKALWRAKLAKYVRSPEVMTQASVVVLCVAHTPQRQETLMRWSEGLVDGRFWFSHLDAVCYTYDRVEKTLVRVRNGNPLGRIWRVVTDSETHALFSDR